MHTTQFCTATGYIAGGLWLLTFYIRRMTALRFIAILSLCLDSLRALLGKLYPFLFVRAILLPLNTFRFSQAAPQAERTVRSERALPTQAVWRFLIELRRVVRGWRDRTRQRRELARLRSRDFGDLPVPDNLLVEESRKWPWQRFSPQWAEIRPENARRRLDPRTVLHPYRSPRQRSMNDLDVNPSDFLGTELGRFVAPHHSPHPTGRPRGSS